MVAFPNFFCLDYFSLTYLKLMANFSCITNRVKYLGEIDNQLSIFAGWFFHESKMA